MAFRRPVENRSSPSLGYRLSSDRQPGVEIANNRMPSKPMPRFSPEDMPRRGLDQMPEYFKPIGRPGMGSYQNMGQTNMGQPLKRPESFTNLDMLGRPDLAFRYSHMEPGREESFFGSPEDASIRGTYRRTDDARRFEDLDEYGYLEGAPRRRTTFSEGSIGPNSFNEMYGGVYDDAIFRTVDPNTNQIEQFPMAEGIEQAAVDPSDYRTIMKIIEQGLNPEDYMASTGIMGALPKERQVAELGLPQPLDYQNERLSLDELIELGASQEQIAQYLGVA